MEPSDEDILDICVGRSWTGGRIEVVACGTAGGRIEVIVGGVKVIVGGTTRQSSGGGTGVVLRGDFLLSNVLPLLLELVELSLLLS